MTNSVLKNEFLSLTDYETGDVVFLDCTLIATIRQLQADQVNSRRTRIDVMGVTGPLLVQEEAVEVALRSGRGFYGPKDESIIDPV
jgi:hypothetical protein